jgi:hypothetical protein
MELWGQHLAGTQGLGIVPINEQNQCHFGAIDVDDYSIKHKELNKQIQLKKLPLVLTRTKSGGAHLYCFTTEPVEAELMMTKLREMATALGQGKAEVFPKQTKLLIDRGDVGSWINMPYFHADKTTRYALDDCGVALNTEEFIRYVHKSAVSREQLRLYTAEAEELLPGGPPCLQFMARDGFPEGTRNAALFNLGIYAKKARPDTWKTYLEELNAQYMKPLLTASEVLGVIKSLDRHEYNYTCKSAPIESHCNAEKCRKCKFGVGQTDFGMPRFGSLTKLDTSPPVWFLDIEGGDRMELTSEELQSPMAFQRRCMEVLHTVPQIPKRGEWTEILARLFEAVNVVGVPKNASARGILLDLFEEFVTSRVQAKSKEELLLGKPLTTDGATYFRLKDLMKFLERQRFTAMSFNDIVATRKDTHDLVEHRFRIGDKILACLKVKALIKYEIDAEKLPGLPSDESPA